MALKKAAQETPVDESSTGLRVTQPEQDPRVPPLKRSLLRTALRIAGSAAVLGAAYWLLFSIVLQTAPFRVDPEQGGFRIEGLSALGPEEIRQVFADDSGQSLAAVDISGRLLELRSIPWVKTATAAKVWPRTIAVTVVERKPVAFLRLPVSNAVRMIDADGVILDLRAGGDSSLPVITGIDEAMPIDQRRRRVNLFETVMEVFGAKGRDLAKGVSEIDVSDSGNAVVLTKHQNRMIKLQMGDRHFQHRLDVFLNYIDAWKSEFGPVEAVDLRFEKQVAVQPANDGRKRG